MKLNFKTITVKEFLAEYWQKKPLLIRQGLSDFNDFLSPDEMAGLACEAEVESRRVFHKAVTQKKVASIEWQVESGPFESYEHLGDRDWSLVIQALNHWVPDVEQLIQCFDFLPRWRLDDVMASFAAVGGGVGPHVDSYDVFICQGSGRRHWRVGEPDRQPTSSEQTSAMKSSSALRHTHAFEAIIDVEMKSGDVLYIPTGFPHEGKTIEASMNYSVGYRAPLTRELHSSLADYSIDHDLGNVQIQDPQRSLSTALGMISQADFLALKQQVLSGMNDGLLQRALASHLTQSKCLLDLPEQESNFTGEEIKNTLQKNPLIRLGGLRCLYLDPEIESGAIYVNGEREELPEAEVIPLLCDQTVLCYADLESYLDSDDFVDVLTRWVNSGYWYFDE